MFLGECIPSIGILFPAVPPFVLFIFIYSFFLMKSYAFSLSLDFTLIKEGPLYSGLLDLKFGIVVNAYIGIYLGISSLLKNGC